MDSALSKAVLFFKNTSLNDCTLASLMESMDLTTGSFYKAFGSKNKIFHIVLEKSIECLDNDIKNIIREKGRQKQYLKKFILLILSPNGILGNEIFRYGFYISKDDEIVNDYINVIQNKLEKYCFEILSLEIDKRVEWPHEENVDSDILYNYLLGIYFTQRIPKNTQILEKKVEELVNKIFKDN